MVGSLAFLQGLCVESHIPDLAFDDQLIDSYIFGGEIDFLSVNICVSSGLLSKLLYKGGLSHC